MGAVAAVRVLHRRILLIFLLSNVAMELELAAEHEKVSGGVAKAIEIGAVDEMITPAQTRSALAKSIANAPHRRGPRQHPSLAFKSYRNGSCYCLFNS
jgi:acetyl-CoA/propionyl-CoA carboxylase carboxyl transferase subunit